MHSLAQVPLTSIGVALLAHDADDILDELESLLARPPWHADAACREHPPEWWFPAQGGQSVRAKAVCRSCLVSDECLAWSLDQDVDLRGTWAGLSDRDRRDIRAGRTTVEECHSRVLEPVRRPREPPVAVRTPERPSVCEFCTDEHLAQHHGDVGGRLDRPMDLCNAVYQFAWRAGRLPSHAELEHRAQTGRWYIPRERRTA